MPGITLAVLHLYVCVLTYNCSIMVLKKLKVQRHIGSTSRKPFSPSFCMKNDLNMTAFCVINIGQGGRNMSFFLGCDSFFLLTWHLAIQYS